MKSLMTLIVGWVIISLLVSGCGAPPPTGTEIVPSVEATATLPSSTETPAPASTDIPIPSPSPTNSHFQLEIVQSQAWTDRDGNVRVNVLMRNPYDFPVNPVYRPRADVLNGAGGFIRDKTLYYLDGISGGAGFLLPGETVAAMACFTCETTPLPEPWSSVQFSTAAEDATDKWKYSTDVEATIGSVSFSGDSPLFDVRGTVKNNSDSVLSRISARVFVYDGEGNLVGAAEASAWDVAPGATASFSGVGIGQSPAGPVTYEITALGVSY